MKIGKISESVLKRSVLKQIKTKRNEIINGAGVGEDCAILAFKEDELYVTSMDPAAIGKGRDVRHAIMETANDLAAGGAEPVGMMVTVLLPETTEEAELKKMMSQAESACAEINVQLMGGHTEVSAAVNQPIFIVAGTGKTRKEKVSQKARAGQDIVVTKWIGMQGTSIIAKERTEELSKRFPAHVIEEAKQMENSLSVLTEAAVAAEFGVCTMHDASEGGIFGALWELAESAGAGLLVDLKKLPVKQETIEICEFFEINPYELISGGCLVMAADNGFDLVSKLEKEQIPAVVVGKITDDNDRVVINEEERRYLERPKTDEIYNALRK